MNKQEPKRWTLDTGEAVTVRDLVESPRNVRHLQAPTIYGRLHRGDRSWKELMRSADPSLAAARSRRQSPWNRGPNCKTPRAQEHYAAFESREKRKGGAA